MCKAKTYFSLNSSYCIRIANTNGMYGYDRLTKNLVIVEELYAISLKLNVFIWLVKCFMYKMETAYTTVLTSAFAGAEHRFDLHLPLTAF